MTHECPKCGAWCTCQSTACAHCTQWKRLIALLALVGGLLCGPYPLGAQGLELELRVGAVTTFGDSAERGTEPFAQLRTGSRLNKPGTWQLMTWTRLTAAPGAEFDLRDAGTFRALDFELALAKRKSSESTLSLCAIVGAQAKAFEPDEPATPASRRAGPGLLVSSGKGSWLLLAAGWDERQGGWGTWLGAGAEITPGLSLTGTATVGWRSTSLRLAAAMGWR